MKKKTIGVFVGSLRNGSYNDSVARYLAKVAPAHLDLRFIDIGHLPLYNQDFDNSPPESYVKFRDEVRALDGFLFVTPEHNRSIPAALKNALDIASRPYGANVWSGKPAGVVSVSIGAIGGFGANHHLRQVLSFVNVPVMQQPEAYVGSIMSSVDDKGDLTSDSLKSFLKDYIDALAAWFEKF